MNNNSGTPIFDIASFAYKKNYAIEASAGTGKTYSITQIVKRLLLDFHVGLDKILIVTYTEKAAGELKNRIREILTTPDKDLGGKIIAEILPSNVNCDVDNASIGTIHSFCKNTIKEFALSSNQPINLDLTSQTILSDFAKNYIRTGDILIDISKALAFDMLIDEEKLVDAFVEVTNKNYLNYEYKEDPQIISYNRTYQDDEFDGITFQLYLSDDPISLLQQKDPESYNAYVTLRDSSNENGPKLATLFKDFHAFITDERGIQALKDGDNNYNAIEKKAVKRLFELKKPFIKGGFKLEQYLVDKYNADFYKAFQLYKENNRLQSFNDMIRVVREEILKKDSLLLECLRKKFEYGIIDEFQDTNQIQFDIFKNIFMCDGHNIIVVGDPKQSIYAYQGADVQVYQNAVDVISANGEKCRLAKNYRSSPGVVEFGNKLFTYYPFDTQFEPSLYCKLSNGEKERRAKYKGNLISGLWLNEELLSPEKYAKFAVQQILNCVSTDESGNTNLQLSYIEDDQIKYRNVDFSDFVVLARTRSEMPHIQKALKNAGIPYLRYKDTSLFLDVECQDWIALLEAINVDDFTGFNNRGYFRKALFTRFFNYPLEQINNEIYESDEAPEIALFTKWRVLASKHLWLDLFDEIIIDTKLDSTLKGYDNLQSLAVFKQIATYCVNYLSNNNDLDDLIKHLKSLSKYGDEEPTDESAALVGKATEFKCVRMMTMHASKGLQFPVVISVGGWKGPMPSSPAYTCHCKCDDGTLKHIITLEKLKEVNAEELSEFYRLFYVAYTRPEYLLIAPRYDKKVTSIGKINSQMEIFKEACANEKINVDGQSVPLYEVKPLESTSFKDLKEKTEKILSKNKPQDQTAERIAQEQALKDLVKDKDDKHGYKHSYSSLAHPEKETDEETIDDILEVNKDGEVGEQEHLFDQSGVQVDAFYDDSLNPNEIPPGYPKGAEMGNAIHEVFERLNFIDFETNLDDVILERFDANGFNLRNHAEWMEYTKNIVKTVLNSKLPKVKGGKKLDEDLRLNKLENKDKKPEIEFNFNYPNEMIKNYLNGFIDLLFKQGDVYSILDWKSDTLSSTFLSYSKPESLKGQVDERYSIQRVLYSYCLIKWLKQYYKESEEELFNNHFGGIYYVFVRGCNENTSNGIYVHTWNSWSDLEKEFNEIIKAR